MNREQFKDLVLYAKSRGFKTVLAAVEAYLDDIKNPPYVFFKYYKDIVDKYSTVADCNKYLKSLELTMPSARYQFRDDQLAIYVRIGEFISNALISMEIHGGITKDQLIRLYKSTDNSFGYYAHRWINNVKGFMFQEDVKYHAMVDQVIEQYHQSGDKEAY